MTTIPHDHDIDGKLHRGCAQCEAILRIRGYKVADREIEQAQTSRAEIAARNKAGRDQLAREGKSLADLEREL